MCIWVQAFERPEEGFGASGAGAPGGCEWPHSGAGNRTLLFFFLFWKSRMYFRAISPAHATFLSTLPACLPRIIFLTLGQILPLFAEPLQYFPKHLERQQRAWCQTGAPQSGCCVCYSGSLIFPSLSPLHQPLPVLSLLYLPCPCFLFQNHLLPQSHVTLSFNVSSLWGLPQPISIKEHPGPLLLLHSV